MFLLYPFFNEKVSRNTWILTIICFIVGARWITFGGQWIGYGGILLALALGIIATGQAIIRPNPLEVALLTVWNVRFPFILTEGNKLLPKLFPFLVNFIRIAVGRQTHNYAFEVEARSKRVNQDTGAEEYIPAGRLWVEMAVIGQPDYKVKNAGARMKEYLVSGGEAGVHTILERMLQSTTRTYATSYEWNLFMSLKAPLQVALLTKLADSKMRKLPRDGDNFRADAFDLSDEEYMRLPVIDDPFEYFLSPEAGIDEYRRRMREFEQFLKICQINGGGDIHHLGFRIQQLNVMEIKPLGDLAESIDDPAREDIERVSEGKDFDTELALADKYLARADARGEKMTLDEALERVRINRGRAKEFIVRGGNPLTNAAAILGLNQNN